jgi:glutathione S-transferase
MTIVITVYGYVPAWGLPCISPYVTKIANYLAMTGQEFTIQPQDLARLDEDSPHGKLPYIVDADGTKVGDSNRIIGYLKKKYGDALDADMSASEAAQALAWNRLLEEHLYWDGVIQPRWREDSGWNTYIPYIVGDIKIGPELQAFLDAFRQRILSEFDGQGMGRRNDQQVFEFYQEDINALSDFLADKPFFMGDIPRSLDASAYSSLRHVMDVPFDWPGVAYARSKPNLVAYIDRMRTTYGI